MPKMWQVYKKPPITYFKTNKCKVTKMHLVEKGEILFGQKTGENITEN
jgi:hypothetical protein